ncbi:MAG: HAD family phosphatase [Eubacteriales bacterium]|nr:HAD family phosphatase [Eubacteriales bacterium]
MKAAIFDLDGTILDSLGACGRVFARCLSSMEIETDEPLDQYFADNGYKPTVNYIQQKYLVDKTSEELQDIIINLLEQEYAESISAFDGACEFVNALHRNGLALVLLTANRRVLAQSALHRLGLKDCFISLIAATEAGISKSDPKTYTDIVQMLGVSAQDCYMFDDSQKPLAAATEAGLMSVGVFHNVAEADAMLMCSCSRSFITSFSKSVIDRLLKCH